MTPSCIAAMKRGGSRRDPQHGARAPVPLALELADARPPRGDEAVLAPPRRRRSAGSGPPGRAAREGSSWRLERACLPRSVAAVVVQARTDAYPSERHRTATRTYVLYCRRCGPRTAIEPCKSALNRVTGMPFAWSLNPYMGCVHRCTFCYVRAFELRADRPRGRALRHVDPGEGEHRRRAAARARAAVVAAARASRSAPRPIPTSRPRAASG